jgi:lipooligosaccharide transport system ATP-binding protein
MFDKILFMRDIIISNGLVKKFGDFTAVKGISFNIHDGECFGFLGPNGAGKTTTVKMIHCVSPVTSGQCFVDGFSSHIDDRRIKMITGVIPQEMTLDIDLTVYENLMVFSRFFDIPSKEAKVRVDELLEFVELTGKRNTKIDELSGGMKRRLLIARALINKPKLIIADEPTVGLDPQARHLVWQRLRALKKQGVTLVLTTQYMEEAAQLCDRIVIMYEGKILKEGIPQNMVDEEIGKEVVEIRIPAEEDEMLLSQLKHASCGHERVGDTIYFYCKDGQSLMKRVVELNLPKVLNRPATLEDVFLKLTGRSLGE